MAYVIVAKSMSKNNNSTLYYIDSLRLSNTKSLTLFDIASTNLKKK